MSVPPENTSQSEAKNTEAIEEPEQTTQAMHITVRSTSRENTVQLGTLLGELLLAGDMILQQGDLGAGKTAFAQGIGRGLGVSGAVNSPTFTLLKEYSGRLPLYHFDLYRIEDPDELTTLGFDDYFTGIGVCVVEWAERAEHNSTDETTTTDPWPASYLRMQLQRISANQRQLTGTARGKRGMALLAAYKQAIEATQTTSASTTKDEKDEVA